MDVWDGSTPSRSASAQRAPDRGDWEKCIEQVAATQTAVNVNAANRVTDAAGIASAEADILTNAADITTAEADILTNAADAASNAGEIVTLQSMNSGYNATTLQSYGTLETVSGLAVTEYGNADIHKTVLTLTSVELDTVDGTTPATDGAWSALKLYTFPTGTKLLDACHINLDSLENNAGADGITATADFDIGVGSVAVAQASAFSLSGTQSDYAAATVALTASASTGDTNTNTTRATHTSTDLYLNLRTVDDADHGTAAGLLEVTGTIVIYWTMLE